MLYSFDQVALYLNRATLLIKASAGSLKFITGNDGTKVSYIGAKAEETQILTFGDAVWIANNDDNDSTTQREYLNKMGVSTRQELMDHVEAYQGRALKTHQGKFTEGGMTSEEKLLYRLASRNDQDRVEKFSYPGTLAPALVASANATYKLSAEGPPPSSGIVFVTGSYVGSGGPEHAEQKLLAALSKCGGNVRGSVTISGCKMACSICEDVLDSAKEKLKNRFIQLNYNSSFVNSIRNDEDVGLRKKNSHGIKALDTARYFD